MIPSDREPCPACGGAGGGPFGRAGSAWDIETYECPRCEGWGYIRDEAEWAATEAIEPPRAGVGPGIAKTVPERIAEEADRKKKGRASGA